MGNGIDFTPTEIAVLGGVLASLVGAIGVLWRSQQATAASLITSFNDRLLAVITDRNQWREIAEQAVEALGDTPEGRRLRRRIDKQQQQQAEDGPVPKGER